MLGDNRYFFATFSACFPGITVPPGLLRLRGGRRLRAVQDQGLQEPAGESKWRPKTEISSDLCNKKQQQTLLTDVTLEFRRYVGKTARMCRRVNMEAQNRHLSYLCNKKQEQTLFKDTTLECRRYVHGKNLTNRT